MEKIYTLTEKGAQALRKQGIPANPGELYAKAISPEALRSYLRIGFIAEVVTGKPTIYSKLTDAEKKVLFDAIDDYVEAENAHVADMLHLVVNGMLQMLVASKKMTEQQAEQCIEETEEHRAEWRG